MTVAAPVVHEIAVIAREISRVGTLLRSESFHLSVLVSHIHLAVVRIEHGCLEVNVTRLLVHTVDGSHIIVTLLHLTDQFAVHIVEIEVHIAVAVARKQDVLLAHDAVLYHFFLHKLRNDFLDELLALTGERIYGIEAHIVLMAIHRIDDEAVGIRRSLDARIIAVSIYRHIQSDGLARLHIVAPEAHLGIILSCLRIFIGILARIVVELLSGRI